MNNCVCITTVHGTHNCEDCKLIIVMRHWLYTYDERVLIISMVSTIISVMVGHQYVRRNAPLTARVRTRNGQWSVHEWKKRWTKLGYQDGFKAIYLNTYTADMPISGVYHHFLMSHANHNDILIYRINPKWKKLQSQQ